MADAEPLSKHEREEIAADLLRNNTYDVIGAYADDLERYEATVQALERQLAAARRAVDRARDGLNTIAHELYEMSPRVGHVGACHVASRTLGEIGRALSQDGGSGGSDGG